MRPPRLWHVALVALALLSPWQARAGDSPLADYTLTTWTEIDGLPTGRIRAIQQDIDGYLWLATESALVRFDGVRFDPCGALGHIELARGMVPLVAARDHSLWTAVAGASPIARIKNGKTTVFGAREGYLGTNVLSLLEDHAGTIWATSFQGLFRFTNGRWQRLGASDGLPDGSMLAVYEDQRRTLWVATPSGVFRRAADHAQFEQVDQIGVSSNVWHSFAEDAQGQMWMSDFRSGFRRVGSRSGPNVRGWGVRLLRDGAGMMWVGTQGQGLWRVRDTERANGPVVERITADEGLLSDAILSLFEDREGNLWVGTNAGLHRLAPHHVTQVKQLPVARAIERTPDGSIWVGTVGGLTRFAENGTRRTYTERDGLQGAVVLALTADARGDLWVATERGVSRFSNGEFSPVIVRASEQIQRVFAIASAGGTVWMRDLHARLFRLRDGVAAAASDLPDAVRLGVTVLASDRQGSVWIGNMSGQVTIVYADGHHRTLNLDIGNISCLVEDSTGAIWACGGRGVGRIAGERVETVTQAHGFPGNAKAIVEDADGAIWVGGGTGIVKIERAEFERIARGHGVQVRYRLFNTTDGVAGTPVTDGSRTAERAADGRLWFATSGGVTVIDPRHVGEPRPTPPARIETVTTNAGTFTPAERIDLPARTSQLQIGFTALALGDPGRVRFRYRLDGFDSAWVDAGTARHASYANLPPGNYAFRVAASSSPGIWSDSPAWEFVIEPAIYQTKWFYGLCAMMAVLVVYGAWQLRVRQVRRQFALVLAERIRMSRAIHDTLLQGLAALALQLDDLSHSIETPSAALKDRLLRMRKRIEEDVRQARKSIWDLRSPKLENGGLLQAIRDATERTAADWPLQVDFTVKGTPQASTPIVQEQVLHICQEALNNAVHHGRANRVAVELAYGDDRLRLRVTDDGCGFDPDAARAAGDRYGLISMRERAEHVRGHVTIASAPGAGTSIETVVPIA